MPRNLLKSAALALALLAAVHSGAVLAQSNAGGGGGASGGTGGAATVADGADVAEGARADAAATNSTASWSVVALLKGIYAGLLAPTPAGTNTIGSIANITGTVSLPTGAATAANQTTEITALQAANARSSLFADANKAAYTAGSQNFLTPRAPTGVFNKFNITAGCSQAATLQVRASNDSFVSSVYLTSAAISAGSDTPPSTVVAGTTITVPVNFASYQAIIVMGATAGTCTASSSLTAS